MESIIAPYNIAALIEKIHQYESKIFDQDEIKQNPEKIQLALCFFKTLKNINVDIKIKEFSIRLYDLLKDIQDFNLGFKKIFLLSLFNISLKIYETPSKKQEIMSYLIELVNENNSKNLDGVRDDSLIKENSAHITIDEIHMAEIFLLNNLDWKFNMFFIHDYIKFFINNYFAFDSEDKSINEETLYSFINIFTESALTAFNTKNIYLHSVAICIIIISFDQFIISTNYNNKIKPMLIEFLKSCHSKFSIDLVVVENYKKMLLDFLEFMDCEIIKLYPDENIKEVNKFIYNNNCESPSKCLMWDVKKNVIRFHRDKNYKNRFIILQNKRDYQEDVDESNDVQQKTIPKKLKTIRSLKLISFQEDQP